MCIRDRYTPITEERLKKAIYESLENGTPCAIRYPRGTENEKIKDEFYSAKVPQKLSAVSNFPKDEYLDLVIITDSVIVTEAMKASTDLSEKGIKTGIILLEKIKPFSECAENICALLPQNEAHIIFLEEEIRSGGMGMNISDEMIRKNMLSYGNFDIIAVDDNFVPRHKGKTIYEEAGVCAKDIENLLFLKEKVGKRTSHRSTSLYFGESF